MKPRTSYFQSLINVVIRNSFSEAVGGYLLALLFFMLVSTGVCFLVHWPVTAAILPLSIILAGGFTYMLIARGRTFLWSFLFCLLTVVCSCFICSLIYDRSFDSNYYHYKAVIMITEGWNPVSEAPWEESLWNQHYAKGLEMMQAVILAFTGNLQSTKCLNIILILAAASLTWFTLGDVFTGISRLWKAVISLLVVLNPVVICQLPTAYNDHMLWSECVVMCCCFLLIWRQSKRITPYLLLMMILTMGINSKFTHFYYLGTGCLFFAIWCIFTKKYGILMPGMVTVAAALAIGVLLVGYNPYVTNTIGYGNPFYPLVGSDVDIMTDNTPPMFQDSNRFVSLAKSFCSTEGHPWAWLKGKGFKLFDCFQAYYVDSRVNGFGVLMPLILLFGLLLMAYNRASGKWWIVWLFFLLICFSFEQSWWARYVPFLWALVIIPVLNYAVDNHKGSRLGQTVKKAIAFIILSLIFINSTLAILSTMWIVHSYTSFYNYIFQAQKECGTPIKVTNMNMTACQIFKEKDISYEECELKDMLKDQEHMFIIMQYPHADVIAVLPAEEYPEMYRKPTTFNEIIIDLPLHRFYPEQTQE